MATNNKLMSFKPSNPFIIYMEIYTVMHSHYSKKWSRTDSFTVEFSQLLKQDQLRIFLKILHKIKTEARLPNLFYESTGVQNKERELQAKFPHGYL